MPRVLTVDTLLTKIQELERRIHYLETVSQPIDAKASLWPYIYMKDGNSRTWTCSISTGGIWTIV